MCLYPRLIENRKYRANKKNGGEIPPIKDHRVRYVPIGCQECIECRKQKSREWSIRLQEDIKTNKNAQFITLTYSTESLKKLIKPEYTIRKDWKKRTDAWPPRKHKSNIGKKLKEQGYDLDNAIATKSMRLFLERWRKEYGKSLRHWMITELGDKHTEHMHMHGIIWTTEIENVEKIWQYGKVWTGYTKNGKRENYVNGATVGYITKYITKIDEKHTAYKPIILTSPGIGNNYTNTYNSKQNKYNGTQTNETYRTEQGTKMAIPIYWRNKIYTDEEREQLWLYKLDKAERWVCGEKVEANDNETYNNLVEYHRRRTMALGYKSPQQVWNKKAYEEQRRNMLRSKRLE